MSSEKFKHQRQLSQKETPTIHQINMGDYHSEIIGEYNTNYKSELTEFLYREFMGLEKNEEPKLITKKWKQDETL